jgi:hypothetical protein
VLHVVLARHGDQVLEIAGEAAPEGLHATRSTIGPKIPFLGTGYWE